MGYICSYCKQSFTRCAFISHITEKKCSSAAAVNDSKQVLPNSLSSEHVQSKSSSKLKKGKDSAPKVLENGSLFMVVKLDDKKTPYEKIHKSASSSSGRHSGDSANVLNIGNKISKTPETNGEIADVSTRTLSSNNLEDEASHHSPSSELQSIFEDNIIAANDSNEFFELTMPSLEASCSQEGLNGVVNIFEDFPIVADDMEVVPELEEPIVGGINGCDAYIAQASQVQENSDIEEIEMDENVNVENITVDEVPLPIQADAPKGLTKQGNPRKRAAPKKKGRIKIKEREEPGET